MRRPEPAFVVWLTFFGVWALTCVVLLAAVGDGTMEDSVALGIAASVGLVFTIGALALTLRRPSQTDDRGTGHYVILALLPIAIFSVAVALWLAVNVINPLPEGSLTVLIVAAVLALLVGLGILAVFFKNLGLANPREALGLPQGSVRAVIAIALIFIFAIMTTYFYSSLSSETDGTRIGITAAEKDAIPPGQIINQTSRTLEDGTVVYDVDLVVALSSDAVDVAKQVVTTVSTLVVSIAGFYFGSSAVAAATSSVATATAATRRRIAVKGPKDPTLSGEPDAWIPATLDFEVETTPPGLAVRSKVFGDGPDSLAEASYGRFEYTPQGPGGQVLLRFELVVEPAVNAEVTVNRGPGSPPDASDGTPSPDPGKPAQPTGDLPDDVASGQTAADGEPVETPSAETPIDQPQDHETVVHEAAVRVPDQPLAGERPAEKPKVAAPARARRKASPATATPKEIIAGSSGEAEADDVASPIDPALDRPL